MEQGVNYNEGTESFETRRIGDHEYKVEAFSCDRAITLGEPLMDVLTSASAAITDQMGFQAAARGIMQIRQNIIIEKEELPLWKYIELLFGLTTIDGQKMVGDYDWKHFFKRKYDLLYDVLAFVLEVNYASFLPVLSSLLMLIGITLKKVPVPNPNEKNQTLPNASKETTTDG